MSMSDTLLDEQRRILKLGHVLKNLNLSHSSKHLLANEDATEFKELFFNTLEAVNKLSKFLLLAECQIDKENVFKTIQSFLEQQEITGNIKEDLDEFTRYVALDSVFSQLMTLRLCLWRDPSVKHNHEIYSIARALEIEEREPVKVLECATKKVNEMKSSLPPNCIEPIISTPISTDHHTKFDEINTQFKEEYARLKLRYVESFDRSFQNMMSDVSEKHEKYLRVKQERARVKIESSFSMWDTYNARWDLITDLSRCALRRRTNNRAKGKRNTGEITSNTNVAANTSDDENIVKTHVENIQIEHVVTKAQKKYAKVQQAKQKKKDQKKRRKMKELGLLDTEEEKRAEAGEDNEEEGNDNEHEDEGDDENNEENNEPLEPKKKNRNKSEKQERRLKKKSKKDVKTTPVPANNNNNTAAPLKDEGTTAPLTKVEKKKQKFVVVVGDDGGVDLGEKN